MADTDMANPPVGASVWERDLWQHLQDHVEKERTLLDAYAAIARETQSKAFGYLVKMLLTDELNHHRIFIQLAASLRAAAELGRNPIIPDLDFEKVGGASVLDATRQLAEIEGQDRRELEELRKELRDVRDTTLWSLLVELMQRDTEKHLALLQFVESHVERASR
jgi:hypothetical protein